MAHLLSLVSSLKELPAPKAGLVWRSDLDPDALPPTDDLTAGQRRVLVACLELFATNGFAGSSTRDIAAKAQMQSPSLYNHFPSKEAMLSTLVLLGHEHHHHRLMSAVIGAGGGPVEQLAALMRQHVLDHCDFPRLATISNFQISHLSPEVFARVQVFRKEGSALLHEILRRGNEVGVFHVVGIEITAGALASMGVAVAPLFPYTPGLAASDLADHYALMALRMVGVCDHLDEADGAAVIPLHSTDSPTTDHTTEKTR